MTNAVSTRNAADQRADAAPHVGFYVHYHGRGHAARVGAILRSLSSRATVFTSRNGHRRWAGPTLQEVIDLPCDIDGVPEAGAARQADLPAAHFTPLWTPTITDRVAILTRWMARVRPAAMVVDVSSEVALLSRLAGIPTVCIRQHGDRRDAGHENAYHAAGLLLAPFPERLEDDMTPGWVRRRTVYSAGFCRYDDAPPPRETARRDLGWTEGRHVLVMTGGGGTGDSVEHLCDAARACPDWQWHAVGRFAAGGRLPENLHVLGWVDDPRPYVRAADVVVSAAGHNSVMELAHSRARVILIPEERPFQEQARKAAVLQREGLAVVRSRWPDPCDWPATLAEAMAVDPAAWRDVTRGEGAGTLATAIDRFAAESQAVWDAGVGER